MKAIPKLLSKTKLLRGYRCQKCIYLTVHHPELEAPITPETQALFDQGNLVGAEARKHYPGGQLVDNKPWDFGGALAKTRELMAAGTPILYEAAFEYMGCYARADIIRYSAETQRWTIYEVKSTTKAKPEHIDDIGLQAWIMAKSGIPLERMVIVHLNTECTYPDLSRLFTEVDVTEEVRAAYLNIKPRVRDILNLIRQNTVPNVDIGPYCLAPTECGFTQHCWKEKAIPEFSIFDIPGLRDKKWDLYHAGIINVDDARLHDLNALQERIVNCFKTGSRFTDPVFIKEAMSTWQFPLVFLDFETINPAIPRYTGCRPYQQVPFQFSVHLWPAPDAAIIHHAFLHDETTDPRPTLTPALLEACGTHGSIVAYFGKFESERISELALFLPEYADALTQLQERIVDPLPIIREAVYDNAFAGSFSLKRVAPALLGDHQRYDGMVVADGGAAQRAYEALISPVTPEKQKQALKEAMLAYCEKDTWVMVELVKWLFAV